MLAAMAWWLGAKGGAVWHTRKKRRCRATKAILNLISERGMSPPGRPKGEFNAVRSTEVSL